MAKWQYKKIDRSVVLQDHNANSQYYKTKRTNRTDDLSEYERKKMYEDIANSVHKERQEYYKPVLKKLAEKQYMLYIQAIRAGIEVPREITHSFVKEETLEIKMETELQDPAIEVPNPTPTYSIQNKSETKCEAQHSKNQFLESFKINVVKEGYTLLDMLYTRDGAFYLRDHLREANQQDITVLFKLCLQNYFSLSCAYYGNYVVQKVLDLCCSSERDNFFFKLYPDMKTIATNPHGTRVVQCLLNHLKTDQLLVLRDIVARDIVDFSINEYACHVVFRLTEKLISIGPETLDKFVDAMMDCVHQLLFHPIGVKIIVKILYTCTDEQKQPIKVYVLNRLRRDSKMLLQSKCYLIIKELYENGNFQDRSIIFQACLDILAELSCDTTSSLLLDTLFTYASKQEMSILVKEMRQPAFLSAIVRNDAGILTLNKLVDLLEIGDLVRMFVQLKQLKSPLPLPYEATQAFKTDLLSKLSDQWIVDIASEYLISKNQYSRCKQFGVTDETLKTWMLTIFKGDELNLLNIDNCVLLIMSMNEIARQIKDNTNIGVLRICLAAFIKQIITSFN